MLRSVLTFFSTLAIAVMTAAAIAAIMPWLSGRTSAAVLGGEGGLHFESLILGVVLGLFVDSVARYGWGDLPRRMITWVLIRERQFFYYALIAGCVAVLLFY
ncbi:MAG: hypothetical protein WBP38_03750 [Hyphomicrobium sp.]|jgi:hypothetical protein|nr:hypothetical protein [Hyphomicrobium sp.]